MSTHNSIQLSSIRIVLMQTYHPGNIGAVARAMYTMGLSDLVLVNPRQYPDPEATNRAAGATKVLENARVLSSLEEAISDCQQVFATTARRKRNYQRPEKSAKQALEWIKQQDDRPIAFVFGRERMGLSQEDIEQCQQQVYIPGNPDYDVLNLAQAVQIISYECQQTLAQPDQADTVQTLDDENALASQEEIQACFNHLQSSLNEIGFLRQKHPGETMQRLKHFILKAEPNAKEIRMLRGICSSIDWQQQQYKKDN